MAPGECCDKVLWLIIPFWKALWTKQITQAEKRNVIIPYIAEESRPIQGARDTYINSTEPRFHLETLNYSSKAIPKVRGDHITFIPLITQFFLWVTWFTSYCCWQQDLFLGQQWEGYSLTSAASGSHWVIQQLAMREASVLLLLLYVPP